MESIESPPAPVTVREWPRVTWLLPVLDGMPYLVDLLASIAAQEYRNHEIVAWDNGSADATVAVLRAWIPARIPGRVVTGHPLPLGLARARLTELARTELCAAIDADDVHEPARLSCQVRALLDDPLLVAVGCVPTIVDAEGAPLPDWEYPLDDAEIRWRTRWQSSLNAPSVLVRRSAVLRAGNYRDVTPGQDLDLWMRLAQYGTMRNLPDRLVRYRRHANSVTGGIDDFSPVDRSIAAANLDVLFPDLDARAALDLWDAAYPHRRPRRVGVVHVKRLHDAARSAARRAGVHDAYFLTTPYFRRQRRRMLASLIYAAGRVNWTKRSRPA